MLALQAAPGDRDVAEQIAAANGNPADREVQLELILSGVVLEEAVDFAVSAVERGSIVGGR